MDGVCLYPHLLGRLRQEDRLSLGVWGQCGQHSETTWKERIMGKGWEYSK